MVIIEQDRLVKPGDPPPGLPVIVVVPARPRPGATTGRVPPDLIVELVVPPAPGREARYAKNDVSEYWRVEPGPPVRIVVCNDPDPSAQRFRRATAFAGDEPVRSAVIPTLALRPSDL